jgi:hypothetical protein
MKLDYALNSEVNCFNEPRWFLSPHGAEQQKSNMAPRQHMLVLETPDLVPVDVNSAV